MIREQAIFFAGEFMPVSQVADMWRDNGWSTHEIFTEIGFRLGLGDFEQPLADEYNFDLLAKVHVDYMADFSTRKAA